MSAEQIEGRGASGDGFCPSPDEGELWDRLREARAHAEGDPGEGLPLVASLCHELAWDLLEEGLLSDAEALVREELAAVRFLVANDPETFLPRVADACENLAGILWEGGDPAEAEPLYREALSLRRSLAGREPAGDLLSEAAHTCVGLARLLEEREPGEAEELYREALSLRRSLAGQDPAEGPLSEVASSCVDLALFLEDLGRLEEAEPLLREALGTYRSLRGGHALSWAAMVARTGFVLARVLDCAGRDPRRPSCCCARPSGATGPSPQPIPARTGFPRSSPRRVRRCAPWRPYSRRGAAWGRPRSSFGRGSRCTPSYLRRIPSARTSGSGRRLFETDSRSCQILL